MEVVVVASRLRGTAVEAHASSAAAEAAGAAAAASAGDAADVPMLEGAVGARNRDSNALPLPICALAALAAFWARAASGSSKLLLASLLFWRHFGLYDLRSESRTSL